MKVQIVAEIGINHGGNVGVAHAMIDCADKAGADVIKFQTVDPDLVYKKTDPLYEVFRKARFLKSDWISLITHVNSLGKQFLSTPGDRKSADLLESIGATRFKIASDASEDVDFVNYVMAKGYPVIVSMGHLNRFELVNRLLFQYTRPPEYVLHCVSKYPTPRSEANMALLKDLVDSMLPCGYSDHVEGYEASLMAVAYGAQMIEKHLKLSDKDIDASVSLFPNEFEEMVKAIRKIEEMR